MNEKKIAVFAGQHSIKTLSHPGLKISLKLKHFRAFSQVKLGEYLPLLPQKKALSAEQKAIKYFFFFLGQGMFRFILMNSHKLETGKD